MAPWTPINQFIPYCPFQKALLTVGSNMAGVTIIYCFSLKLSAAPQTHGHRGQQDVCAACREQGELSTGWHTQVELCMRGELISVFVRDTAPENMLPKWNCLKYFRSSKWIIINRWEGRNPGGEASDKCIRSQMRRDSLPSAFFFLRCRWMKMENY